MIPQEKANELFERFNKEGLHQISSVINRFIRKEIIKQCALIAVDETLDSFSNIFDDSVIESSNVGGYRNMKKYLTEVKQEIEKL
jgi:hypothetical protein